MLILAPTFLASPFAPKAGHGYFEVAADAPVHTTAGDPVDEINTNMVGAIGMGAGTMLAVSLPWSFYGDGNTPPALNSAGEAKVFFVGEVSEEPVVASVYAEVTVPVWSMVEVASQEGGSEFVAVNMSFLLGKHAGPVTIEAGGGYTHRFGPDDDAAPWRARLAIEGGGAYVAADGTGSVQTEGVVTGEWTRMGGGAGYAPHPNFTLGVWGGWTIDHRADTGAADVGVGVALHG